MDIKYTILSILDAHGLLKEFRNVPDGRIFSVEVCSKGEFGEVQGEARALVPALSVALSGPKEVQRPVSLRNLSRHFRTPFGLFGQTSAKFETSNASNAQPRSPPTFLPPKPKNQKEGSSSISRPLIIAREGKYVRLAHYSVETYDVNYDPLVEFEIVHPVTTTITNTTSTKNSSPSTESKEVWKVVSVYKFYAGHKDIETPEQVEEATRFVREWAKTLLERGYNDTKQGVLRRIGSRHHDSHL